MTAKIGSISEAFELAGSSTTYDRSTSESTTLTSTIAKLCVQQKVSIFMVVLLEGLLPHLQRLRRPSLGAGARRVCWVDLREMMLC